LSCLPPDGGLYVPDQVMDIRQFFLHMDESTGFKELVAAVAPAMLLNELNPPSASRVAESAYNFEPELIRLDEGLSILNLYNGPTGVFKDYGIAFLSALMEELTKNSGQTMILSAARGDTGVSMAHAFSGRKGQSLVLLYPSGPIRGLNPAAFVPNGGNIIPIQVKGTFDDCQRLIAGTINDRNFAGRYNITSANAINAGRLLPQTFYYLYAFIRIKKYLAGDLIFSVPCGNFGNLIAGLYAWKYGMPVNGFIAAMNANNAFGGFFRGESFVPKPVVSTNSPALDVSIPSNYERLVSFYQEAPSIMRNMVYPASISDEVAQLTMEFAWKKYGINIDSHTAVALAAAQQTGITHEFNSCTHTVVLATGHPARSADLIRKNTGQAVEVPEYILNLQKKTDPVAIIPPQLAAFQGAIASCF